MMRRFLPRDAALAALLALPLAAAPALITPVLAAERSSPEAAKALVQEAVAYFKEKGAEAAIATFNDPKGSFVRKDLYVFVFDTDGRYVASGANPKLAGTDASGLKDAAGTPLVQQMIAATKDKPEATVDYVWLNRASNHVEHKHSFVVREGKYILGVGSYAD